VYRNNDLPETRGYWIIHPFLCKCEYIILLLLLPTTAKKSFIIQDDIPILQQFIQADVMLV